MIRSAFFPGHCTVTWTIVVCETAPDWAVTTIEAVPRFGCVLLPYPPQPLSVSDSATVVSAAVTVSSEARAWNDPGLRPLPTQKLSIVHTFASELVPKSARYRP